jgi:hypothetical protein
MFISKPEKLYVIDLVEEKKKKKKKHNTRSFHNDRIINYFVIFWLAPEQGSKTTNLALKPADL